MRSLSKVPCDLQFLSGAETAVIVTGEASLTSLAPSAHLLPPRPLHVVQKSRMRLENQLDREETCRGRDREEVVDGE
jgi:hypothetical protein